MAHGPKEKAELSIARYKLVDKGTPGVSGNNDACGVSSGALFSTIPPTPVRSVIMSHGLKRFAAVRWDTHTAAQWFVVTSWQRASIRGSDTSTLLFCVFHAGTPFISRSGTSCNYISRRSLARRAVIAFSPAERGVILALFIHPPVAPSYYPLFFFFFSFAEACIG